VDRSLDELLERFRSGDERAAAELFDRFAERMLALVRRQLSGTSHRAAFDSEGIVQEGFRSFFSAVRKPHFDPHKGSIGGLLARIVLRKAQTKVRRKHPESLAPDVADAAGAMVSLLAGGLTEQEIEVTLREQVSHVLKGFTERERTIVESFLDPCADRSIADVARACRRSLTTVEDVIDRFIAGLQDRIVSDTQRRDGGS
jgi:RNA polymerase sigma-70 factor, ECF subfamily